MRRIATLLTAVDSPAADEPGPAPEGSASRAWRLDRDDLPLTAALLGARRAVSFATPGHRRGRSCDPRW